MGSPRPAPKPTPLREELCGWPVRRPGSPSGWTCNAPFGHQHPHALILAGRARAWSPGYR